MTRVLVDTHVFLWWASWSARVQPEWVPVLTDPGNEVYVSAATAFEIETKRRINKLDFDDDVVAIVARFGFRQLSISMPHAVRAGALDWDHRDPFDRIIAAQAIEDELLVLTADEAMRSAPGVRVL